MRLLVDFGKWLKLLQVYFLLAMDWLFSSYGLNYKIFTLFDDFLAISNWHYEAVHKQ